MPFEGKDYRFCTKHVNRCKNKLNPYIYSDRKAGRPTNKERNEFYKNRNHSSKDSD